MKIFESLGRNAGLIVGVLCVLASITIFVSAVLPQDAADPEPPPDHKWVYTVSHFSGGKLLRTYISDKKPIIYSWTMIVFDGRCVPYRISGRIEIYSSAQFVDNPNEETDTCI